MASKKEPARKSTKTALKGTVKKKGTSIQAENKKDENKAVVTPQKVKTKCTGTIPARTHFIVIHQKSLDKMGIDTGDWSDIENIKKQLNEFFKDIGGAHYTAICTSAKGLKHIHEVVTFDKAKRQGAVSKLYGNAHVEEMRGTKEQAEDYINKRGKFEEKGETIQAIWGDIEAIQNNAGTRTDIKNFDALCMTDDFSIDKFLLDYTNSRSIQMYKDRYYRLCRVKAMNEERDIKVIYVQGIPGSGKTRGVRDRINSYSQTFWADCTDSNNAFPFDGYACERVLVLDELRPGIFDVGTLLRVLDRYPYKVNIKGGNAPACWDTVYITTAFDIYEWFKFDDPGKRADNLRQQFLRRIHEYYVVDPTTHEWILQKRPYDEVFGKNETSSNDPTPFDDYKQIAFINT